MWVIKPKHQSKENEGQKIIYTSVTTQMLDQPNSLAIVKIYIYISAIIHTYIYIIPAILILYHTKIVGIDMRINNISESQNALLILTKRN